MCWGTWHVPKEKECKIQPELCVWALGTRVSHATVPWHRAPACCRWLTGGGSTPGTVHPHEGCGSSSSRLPSCAPSSPKPVPVTEPHYQGSRSRPAQPSVTCWAAPRGCCCPALAHQRQSDVLVRRLQHCRFPVHLQGLLVSPRVVIQSPQRGQDLSLPRHLQCPGGWEEGKLQARGRSKGK